MRVHRMRKGSCLGKRLVAHETAQRHRVDPMEAMNNGRGLPDSVDFESARLVFLRSW